MTDCFVFIRKLGVLILVSERSLTCVNEAVCCSLVAAYGYCRKSTQEEIILANLE